MAHFAIVDINNTVTQVLVVNNSVLQDENGEEQESLGIAFLTKLYGNKTYIQTSFNTRENIHILGDTPFRKNFAGIGYLWNTEIDGFTPPKIYDSWLLNEDKGIWYPPIEMPENKICQWDEENQQWINCLDAET